ncbi:hypothetical protein ABVT39_007061 [Epinephelus coioides]
MKVHHAFICFFFLSLQDGNTGLINAQTIVYSGTEGNDLAVDCSFPNSFIRKFFCKEECEQDDILIETAGFTVQKGRYSIKRRTDGRTVQYSVTISQLTKSDSGRYRCGWTRFPSSYNYIKIIVIDALLTGDSSEEQTLHTRTGGNIVVECSFPRSGNRKYFCKEECKNEDVLVETTDFEAEKDRYSISYVKGFSSGGFLYVNISQLTKSDSGRYVCGLEKSQRRWFRISVTDAPTTSTPHLNLPVFSSAVPSTFTPITTQNLSSSSEGSTTHWDTGTTRDVLLYVGLTLLVMVIISLSVLIIYRKRTSKAKDTPVETETNRVYENFREDRQSRSPPVDSSSIHTYAMYSKPKRAGTSDNFSTVVAARSQNTAEDDLSRLTYSELNFSNQAVGSSSSALRALQGGSPGLVNAEGHRIYKRTEGANITVKCFFTFSGSRKYFCKQKCEDLILVNTTTDSAENGRYSIEYRKKYVLSHPVLLVNITQLTKSDSGRYRCGLDKSWIKNSYMDFEIIVTNASDTSGPDWTLSSTLGSFTPLSTSPETTTQSGLQQTESKKHFEPPVETQNATVSEAAADDSSELSYSVVEFSRVSTTSLNRTTRANANDGIYSVLQLKANSDASHKDASSPLYSTVTLPLQ